MHDHVLTWTADKGWHYAPPARLTVDPDGRIKWTTPNSPK